MKAALPFIFCLLISMQVESKVPVLVPAPPPPLPIPASAPSVLVPTVTEAAPIATQGAAVGWFGRIFSRGIPLVGAIIYFLTPDELYDPPPPRYERMPKPQPQEVIVPKVEAPPSASSAPSPALAPLDKPNEPDLVSKETCMQKYPHHLLCTDPQLRDYRWSGPSMPQTRATTFQEVKTILQKKFLRDDPMQDKMDESTKRGPCYEFKDSRGTHTNVRDRKDVTIFYGSIVCCPCCKDTTSGPLANARCGFVPKERYQDLFRFK